MDEAYFAYQINQILDEFPELTQPNPHQSVFWHYLSGYSLVQIIESGELWATHLSCLNDGREFIHAFKIMQEIFDDFKSREGHTGDFKKFHTFLDSKFAETPSTYSNLYVASLSEKVDDLSQWRAYGGKQGENGYCIGFDTAFLKTGHISYSTNPFLGKVSYDENRHRQMCRRILDIVFRWFAAGVGRDNLDLRAKLIYRWLERYAFLWFPLMKNKSFEDEAEWRIVCRASRSEEANLKFRPRENMISRHVPQTYLRPDNTNLLPIQSVLVGPSRYQDISSESVRLQLASKGYFDGRLGWTPSVEISKIPLQG